MNANNVDPENVIAPVDLSFLERFQETLSADINLLELGVLAAIILAALFVSHFVAAIISKKLTRFFDGEGDDDLPLRFHPLLRATSGILRYGIVALLLLVARTNWDWQFVSEVLLGFSLALATTLCAQKLLRSLNLGFVTSFAASTAIFIFIFSTSFKRLEIKSMSSLLDQAGFTIGDQRISLLTLVSIALVGIFLVALVRLGSNAVRLVLRRNKELDDGQRLLGEKLALLGLVVAAFFIGIDMLGIDLTAFAVFSGAFGLAIGFGMQKTFGNLIAGIILLWDRSIKPGDVIALADTYGSVNKIGIRAVSVITRDGKEHLIPNENLMTNEVENWSYSSKNVRVRIPVGVSYASNMELVQDLLRQSLADHKRILKRPEPRILMTGFGDSSVDFEVRCWIRDPESGVTNFKSDIYNRIWSLFKDHDIEIPFPQRDLNLRNVPESLLKPAAAKPVRTTATKPPTKKK